MLNMYVGHLNVGAHIEWNKALIIFKVHYLGIISIQWFMCKLYCQEYVIIYTKDA